MKQLRYDNNVKYEKYEFSSGYFVCVYVTLSDGQKHRLHGPQADILRLLIGSSFETTYVKV